MSFFLEQVKGIEPSYSAWEADVLPLNYTCNSIDFGIIARALWFGKGFFAHVCKNPSPRCPEILQKNLQSVSNRDIIS